MRWWKEGLELYLAHSRCAINGRREGGLVKVHMRRLAGSKEHATVGLGVVSFSPTLGVKIT